MKPRIYLAGPGVFRPDAMERAAALKALCEAHGLEGVHPLDGPEPDGAAAIYASNVAKIRSCAGVLADLSPFRGPHADDGTAFEVGFAVALGIPVFAWSDATGDLTDMIPIASRESGRPRDADGIEIEDFGLSQNLMLGCSAATVTDNVEEAIVNAAARLVGDGRREGISAPPPGTAREIAEAGYALLAVVDRAVPVVGRGLEGWHGDVSDARERFVAVAGAAGPAGGAGAWWDHV